MANPLLARLNKLQTKLPAPEGRRRFIQITANQGDEEEARRLLQAEGLTRTASSANYDALTLNLERVGLQPFARDRPGRNGRTTPKHGAMHDDLAPKFTCARCTGNGERRRDVFLTVISDYSRLAGRLNNWSQPPAAQ